MAAISLSKVQQTAPALAGLYETAGVSLAKHGLDGLRAAVYLVVDHSGSMRPYYKDGSVQALADRVLGLAAHLDDDGTVPAVFFSTGVDAVTEIALSGHEGRVARIAAGLGHMGRTSYHLAMDAVVDHYLDSGSTAPALVVFQTDGGPSDRFAAEKYLCKAARLPLFWQFIGFGDPHGKQFDFLRRLDDLPVPGKRIVDNAGFFHAGQDPRSVPNADLYDRLVGEFPGGSRRPGHCASSGEDAACLRVALQHRPAQPAPGPHPPPHRHPDPLVTGRAGERHPQRPVRVRREGVRGRRPGRTGVPVLRVPPVPGIAAAPRPAGGGERRLLLVPASPGHALGVRRVRLRAGEPHRRVLAEHRRPLGQHVPELLRRQVPQLLRGRGVLPVRVQQQPPGAQIGRGRVRQDLVGAGAGEGQPETVQIHVHHLVGEGGADVPAMGAEPVVQLDEVLRSGGQFDVGRVGHLPERHDQAGIGEPVVPHQLARHPLRPEIQVVRVAERHVGGGHAGRERPHGVVGQPPVQRRDGLPHRLQVRKPVLHRPAVRHAPTPRRPEPSPTVRRAPGAGPYGGTPAAGP
ncbi:hypothetical protein DN402_25915 [Streptomyces sp. SW4]|nr:hypothetical protein DN402_25915 [Streptomyces sp. SW4]